MNFGETLILIAVIFKVPFANCQAQEANDLLDVLPLPVNNQSHEKE